MKAAEYLRVLAMAYLGAPEDTEEELALSGVLDVACDRCGVDRHELLDGLIADCDRGQLPPMPRDTYASGIGEEATV